MTDIQICDRILNDLTLNPPADTANIAITGVSGGTLQLASSPGGTSNQWVGSIIEVTSGAAAGVRAIIIESSGSVVSYATPFVGNVFPSIGDTVKLYGGPLASAKLFLIEPIGLKEDIKNGVKYFVSVNCIKGQAEWKSFGGHSSRFSTETIRNSYSMEIAMEVEDRIGVGSGADSYNAVLQLPELKEQVLYICYKFKSQEKNRISSDTPVKWTYGFSERPGSPIMRCCMMTFNLNIL